MIIKDIAQYEEGDSQLARHTIMELQEENKQLQERFDRLKQEHIEKIDRVNELREKYENLLTDYRISIEKRVKLEQKIDKAIEYIEKFIPIDNDTILMRENQRDYLLEILKGEDKE